MSLSTFHAVARLLFETCNSGFNRCALFLVTSWPPNAEAAFLQLRSMQWMHASLCLAARPPGKMDTTCDSMHSQTRPDVWLRSGTTALLPIWSSTHDDTVKHRVECRVTGSTIVPRYYVRLRSSLQCYMHSTPNTNSVRRSSLHVVTQPEAKDDDFDPEYNRCHTRNRREELSKSESQDHVITPSKTVTASQYPRFISTEGYDWKSRIARKAQQLRVGGGSDAIMVI